MVEGHRSFVWWIGVQRGGTFAEGVDENIGCFRAHRGNRFRGRFPRKRGFRMVRRKSASSTSIHLVRITPRFGSCEPLDRRMLAAAASYKEGELRTMLRSLTAPMVFSAPNVWQLAGCDMSTGVREHPCYGNGRRQDESHPSEPSTASTRQALGWASTWVPRIRGYPTRSPNIHAPTRLELVHCS